MRNGILMLGLIAVLVLASGCMGLVGPNPKVVQDSATMDISLSKGLVYTIDAQIKNDGADGDVTVTAELIDAEKGFVRDKASRKVFIPSGETRKVSFTLDGEVSRDYQYRIEAR
ncbi:DUF7490 domain-containing protein [Methanoculleus sp. 7T]|uniref:DUF7490 domain-containing protein n=1 Tax=Methanoculleus sp. 7T TaxID=2937282 RepID=UPI0020C16E01|nr:hypothetical protein [Methanoculleus sp. 7T]MCK8518854.1 hypothetical protein [Methanoculleus sp. 7T]